MARLLGTYAAIGIEAPSLGADTSITHVVDFFLPSFGC
jgi:hypothetical protein